MQSCYASLPDSAPMDYRKLASLIVMDKLLPMQAGSTSEGDGPRTMLLGIGGGQGAGKTTLAKLFASSLSHAGQRVCSLSLDDFYLTRSERLGLARDVHPLFETRGPPGTHDIARLSASIDALSFQADRAPSPQGGTLLKAPQLVSIPTFGKAEDDRIGARTFEGPADWILLEGWCVGARALDRNSLSEPINRLEEEQDPEGIWRSSYADFLERVYVPLWERLDLTLFLRVPNLDAVYRWRHDQEKAHPKPLRWNAAKVAQFVAYYERMTRAMWGQAPWPRQITVALGEEHEVIGLSGQSL